MSQEEQPQGKWRQRRASSSSPPKSRWDSPPLQNVSTMSSPTRTSAGSPVSCPICLGTPENKSFSDTCFHEFCFTCLLEWSKIKSECPLCKQPFTRIIHSVRSMDQYEEYQVPEEQPETGESMDDWLYYALNPYVRSAMLNRDPRRRHAIARRFRHFHYQDFVIPRDPRPPRPHRPRPHATGDFRRQVYEDHMWSQLLPDVTGTFREATPRFFRENPAMTHRLVPWLNRELSILVVHSGDPQQIQRLIDMILELIKSHSILSPAFRRHVEPHVGTRAKHFQHEFYTFARSPYDVTGYDQHVHFEHRHEQEDSSDSGSEIEVLEELSPSRSSTARTHISNDILGSPFSRKIGEPFRINGICGGSAAHRCGVIAAGDLLLAVNGNMVSNMNTKALEDILSAASAAEVTTLLIQKENSLSDYAESIQSQLKMEQQRPGF
ncbi:hypothetical protein QYM36_002687 [Artemia franciscana]|uniref:E3 ubiquitin-protein ligase Topors n=1 Tax=Artemia franciscana TaxID=6661 RepID=A0AA88II11_ARTSF|nr:hypothetical protein QYM36_002687 [Artemia franciscana]